MLDRLLGPGSRHCLLCPVAKRTARGGQDNLVDIFDLVVAKRLKHGIVLRIHRQNPYPGLRASATKRSPAHTRHSLLASAIFEPARIAARSAPDPRRRRCRQPRHRPVATPPPRCLFRPAAASMPVPARAFPASRSPCGRRSPRLWRPPLWPPGQGFRHCRRRLPPRPRTRRAARR